MEIITLQSGDVPGMPNLEALDSESLLDKIIDRLNSGAFKFIDSHPGTLSPIEGYKTPLTSSELVVHLCLKDAPTDSGDSPQQFLQEYIADNKLKVVQAVRHTHGIHTRIVANVG